MEEWKKPRAQLISGFPVSVEVPPQPFISTSSLELAAREKLHGHCVNAVFAAVTFHQFAQVGTERIDFFADAIESSPGNGKSHDVELPGLGGHDLERIQSQAD